MSNPIIRDESFPFVCQNPACGHEYDVDSFLEVVNLWGLVYADCGKTVYQGLTCPNCRKTSLLSFPRNSPMVDLRKFIIAPNPHPFANTYEQVFERYASRIECAALGFRSIPAWDDETVSFSDMLKGCPPEACSFKVSQGVPYLIRPQDVEQRLKEENKTGTVQLRRLYPDISKFRNLLTLLSPNRLTKIEFYDTGDSAEWAEGISGKEILERRNAWTGVLERAGGKSLKERIKGHLDSHGFSDFDEEGLSSTINKALSDLEAYGLGKVLRSARNVGFEEAIWKYFNHLFDKTFCSVCTKMALQPKRRQLLGWAKWAKRKRLKGGKALFVDAPMGLGKTQSIKEVLVGDPTLSAVIFMPTIKLCEEMVENLKRKLAYKEGYSYGNASPGMNIEDYEERIKDENGDYLCDRFGNYETRLKKEFLEEEIYFADGIRKPECPAVYFDRIIERYRRKWINKRDICSECEKKAECRFLKHEDKAPKARIVVTTHEQYDRFSENSRLHMWKRGSTGKMRDVFIVDEDIILSKCYQPISLDYEQVRSCTTELTDFLSDIEGTRNIANKIYRLFGQISLRKETAVIPPVDRRFSFPEEIATEWKKTFTVHTAFMPEHEDKAELTGDYMKLIENAIRVGIVVQKYKGRHRVYFPNPKTYDLLDLPPHVFFDGTPMKKKYRSKKLRNVKIEDTKVNVKPLWKLKVWQNENTDLPKKKLEEDSENVKRFVRHELDRLDKNRKPFFLTNKHIKHGYLENFLKKEYNDRDIVLCHYGNLRGVNDANECDVGFMLGSYNVSDAVEIAMGLEFIKTKNGRIRNTRDKYWKWKGSNSRRCYEPQYSHIEELARALRYYEQRQGMARTRHLFHDVDFYVISKDPVSDYEPLAEVVSEPYNCDIFPPRSPRSDRSYGKVKEAVLEWFGNGKNDFVRVVHINAMKKIRRGTVRKYLLEMVDKGLLIPDGKKYRPSSSL